MACALLAATAPAASALVVHGRNHHFFGIQLHRGIRATAVPGSVAAQQQAALARDNGTLSYHSGPIVHSSAPYLIFWTPSGESIAASSQSLMKRYFTDVAADANESDDVYGVTRQYTDATGFAGAGQTFDPKAQVLVDTQPYPPTDTANCQGTTPTCLTDAQLQQELARLVGANQLPTDGAAGAAQFPQNAPIYFIVLPGDVNVCDPAVGCASTTFCAYHSSMTDGGNTLLYAAMPMLLADTSPKSCQADGNSAIQEPNGDPSDVVIGDLSHEDNETITDPTAQGWYDNISGNEEADGCSMTGSFSPGNESDPNAFLPTIGGSASAGTLYDQLINNNRYYTQSEWSNGGSTCKMQPTAGTITPSFTVSGTTTAGTSLSFNPSASTSTYAVSSETWDFGDGSTAAFHTGSPTSVSHAYTAAGTYTVTLTLVDNRGNLQTTTQQVTIAAGPKASFSYSPPSPLEGTSVSFDGTSSTPDPGDTITSYAWSFGDGATGTGATPSHTYATHGVYTVTLKVTDSAGLTNTASQQITVVDEAPTAGFTTSPAPYAVGAPVSFNGSASSDPDGTISSYAWKFGDGATGTGATPSHTYASPGPYTVTLTVTDSDGQSATVSHQITVYSPPTAVFDFSPSSPLEGTAVSFDASQSSDPNPGVTITGYSWKFGDGATGAGATPTHTYATHGAYTVTLTVTDSIGLSKTATQQITVVDEAPTASVTISTGIHAAGQPVSFNGSASSDPDGSISSYAWKFGDGATGSGATTSHTYASPGPYTVTLTVTDSDGQSASTTQQVTISAGPKASFSYSPSSPLEGTSVSFDGTSSTPDPGDTITSYAWSFGDGGTGTGASPSHTYATHGSYTVTLRVTDSAGLTNTASQQVTVADELPTASFTSAPNPAVAGHPVTFNAAASSDADGTINSYAWNFGDGTTGTGVAPNHSYTAAGAYTITLTVTDGDGQIGSATGQLDVLAAPPAGGVTPLVTPAAMPPTAAFVITTLHPAARVAVHFSGARTSSDPAGSITSYSWSFGDGGHGTGVAPVHTYRTAGIYRVSLTVFASSGMSATTSRLVVVVPGSRIKKISILGKRDSAQLAITLTGPGGLSVSARRFAIARAGTLKVSLTPTGAQRRRLQTSHRLTLKVRVAFVPNVGRPTTNRVSITLRG